ncbi:MAG: MFS transporter, partial [Clostridiaceae bacterium]
MLTDRRLVRRFTALCFLVYFSSYITRINFGAVVSEIVASEGILKSSASAVITAGFIFYGIGQIFSGFLGDRIAPNRMIFFGLCATAILNLLIPFCTRIEQMSVVWSLNGLAQSMLWPPLVRAMSEFLPSEQFSKGCLSVSVAAAIGTISVYLSAPVMILASGWRLVFFVCGCATLAAAIVWIVG